MLPVIGDWNAKVGNIKEENVVGWYDLGSQHETGDQLTKFCHINYFPIVNTVFKQLNEDLHTCTPPDGVHRNHIDYIIAIPH